MVYKMTCSVSKNTIRYGKGKIPTTRWQVSWSLMFNSPRKPMDYRSGWQIAGQHDKCYMDKAEMEKYLRGRIKAYSHLFTEISPPIPKKIKNIFSLTAHCLKAILSNPRSCSSQTKSKWMIYCRFCWRRTSAAKPWNRPRPSRRKRPRRPSGARTADSAREAAKRHSLRQGDSGVFAAVLASMAFGSTNAAV